MNLGWGGPWSPLVILMPQWVVLSLHKTSSPYWASRGSDGFDRQEPEKVRTIGKRAGALWLSGFTRGSAASARVAGRTVGWVGD